MKWFFHQNHQGATFLVNAERVKRKLPSLLIEGSTTNKINWNRLMRYRHRYTQFKKWQPEKYNYINSQIILNLKELEKAVNESNDSDRRHKAL